MNRTFFPRMATLMLALPLLAAYQQVSAQAFNKDIQSLAAGYGLGTLSGAVTQALGNYGIQSQSLAGPYYVKYEKGLTNHFGFGFNASLMRNQWSLTNATRTPGTIGETFNIANAEVQRWSYSAVARINYHFARKQNAKLDPYFGTGLGYRSSNWKVETNSSDFDGLTRMIPHTPLAFEFTLGARYYILPNVGVYAEFGGSKSLLQGGLIMNLPGSGNGKPPKPVGNGGSGSSGGGSTSGGKTGGSPGKK